MALHVGGREKPARSARWAIRELKQRGYAIGAMDGGESRGMMPDIVAWRAGPQEVRYFTSEAVSVPVDSSSIPLHRAPLGELAVIAGMGMAIVVCLGLLGAWILSRGVVRPVRRLAEASGRLAEGEAGVTVTPEGPRELRELASVLQRHERQADEGAGDRAGLPALGQPRAQDAVDLDPRLRRGHRRRHRQAARGGCRDRRRVESPRTAGRRPAGLGADAQERLHRAPRDGRSGGADAGCRAPLRRHGARRRLDASPQDRRGRLGRRRQRPGAPGRLQSGRERDPLHAGARDHHDHHGARRGHRLRHRPRTDRATICRAPSSASTCTRAMAPTGRSAPGSGWPSSRSSPRRWAAA